MGVDETPPIWDEPPHDDWPDGWPDEPPAEEYVPVEDLPPSTGRPARSMANRSLSPTQQREERRRQAINDALRRDGVDVLDTLRRILAAQQGRAFPDLADQVRQIKAAPQVLRQLDEDKRKAYDGVLELLLDVAVNCESGAVDLTYMPLASLYDDAVQSEIQAIAAYASDPGLNEHPALAWFALREAVQRAEGKRTALAYVEALEQGEPVEKTVKLFQSIEPPTTKKADVRTRAARTAAEIISAHRRSMEGRPMIRLSSGYRTLDFALSKRGEPMGWIAPGEGAVVAGPTGTGKSSFTYGLVPAMCQDLINWGFPDAKIIFAHTEEESIDKIKAMDVNEGGAFHHLADNLVVANVGTSRKALAMTIYDCVQEAHQKSLETGRPIDQFLPYALVLDYIQSLSEQGETEYIATAVTAEFLLRGVQMWNPDEMEKFSGISYREYAGSPWPEGMENHRVAGVYMAQLVKQDDSTLLYRAGDRGCQVSDFALEDTSPNPVWKGPDGNYYCWDVRENDLRLFKQNAIRGSGVILQNATTIIILHRSRAYFNSALPGLGPDGRPHLEDTRARFLLDKTRTGSALKFVPMAFDLDHKGFRARYIDAAAEAALAEGRFKVAPAFSRSGDPLLPLRVPPSPLASHRY